MRDKDLQGAMNKSVSQICFVLLPGFSPDFVPVLDLKTSFERRGYHVVATNFFGNAAVDDFAELTIEQCQKEIASLIADQAKKYQKVIGVGISLGGALLLEHAKTSGNLHGIVSIGTPFRLKLRSMIRFAEWIFPVVYPVWRTLQRQKDLRLLPIGAGSMMLRYLEGEFLKDLDKISIPTLFIHSKKDVVTDYRVLPEFGAKLLSQQKAFILSEYGNHVIDHDPDFILNRAVEFFGLAEKQPSPVKSYNIVEPSLVEVTQHL
jgi:esterase/lipase